MIFYELATYFQKLESITSRNDMTVELAKLFSRAERYQIGKICYLLQGRVAPLYEPIEFGMANQMVFRGIALSLGIDQKEVVTMFKACGDLGTTVEQLKSKSEKRKTTAQKLKVYEVFEALKGVAEESGAGSQEEKISQFSELIQKVDPLSTRYIVRIVLGKLRLGFSDMTILDALSWMLKGDKSQRKELERAYIVRPDLAYIAEQVKQHGIDGVKHVTPTIGRPILMARANRLTSSEDIIKKIGKCALEYKYDGLRLQVHYEKKPSAISFQLSDTGKGKQMIKMYSRGLEDMTGMFPDIAEAAIKQIKAKNVIFEGEVVAFNPETGAHIPFQQTMQRKRKYNVKQMAEEIPVKLYAFELLYSNGKNFIHKPYKERKAELKQVINAGKIIQYAKEKIVDNSADVDVMFEESIKKQYEGIIAKKLEGEYQAGVRGWSWIKYKKAMKKKLADTLDVLVMGYSRGEGKRSDFGVGQFLTGVYDNKQDTFVSMTKIGTGLTDEQFKEFYKRVKKIEAKKKPAIYDVDKLLEPDVWLRPQLVVEISGDEITRSSVHTAGRIMQPSKSGKALTVKSQGYALRFPRLVKFRDDKRPEEVTTIKEVTGMYRKQGRKK